MSEHNKNTFYFSRPSPFPQLDYIGYVGIIFAIVQFFMDNASQAGFFLVISIIILLLRFWSKFDASKSSLTDFFAFIPYRTKKLHRIDEVLFTEGEVSQVLNSRGSTSSINYTLFKILLVTAEGNLILQEGKNRSKLFKRAKMIAQTLKTNLVDHSAN